MSQEKLLNQLDSDAVIIIDVRTGGDWEDSDIKIKGAIRENPKKLESWIGKYPKDKTLVLYCAWKNEGTSARVAQEIIDMGYPKVYALKGGWVEWEKSGHPTEKK